MPKGYMSSRDKAMQLISQGNYLDGIDQLLRALDEDPRNTDIHLCLGVAYARQGNIESSVDILESAVDIAPTSAKVHYNLGVAYQRAHNITQAKNEYLRALGLDATYEAPKKALDALHYMEHTPKDLPGPK